MGLNNSFGSCHAFRNNASHAISWYDYWMHGCQQDFACELALYKLQCSRRFGWTSYKVHLAPTQETHWHKHVIEGLHKLHTDTVETIQMQLIQIKHDALGSDWVAV